MVAVPPHHSGWDWPAGGGWNRSEAGARVPSFPALAHAPSSDFSLLSDNIAVEVGSFPSSSVRGRLSTPPWELELISGGRVWGGNFAGGEKFCCGYMGREGRGGIRGVESCESVEVCVERLVEGDLRKYWE